MTEVDKEADHIEMTVQRMAELNAQHVDAQSFPQRIVSRLTARLARPTIVGVAMLLSLLWVAGNLLAPAVGLKVADPAPFAWLELGATVFALFTTLMILATQAREEVAARHRSQLTLQLASLTEQKIAKVIALLEEQRRDNVQLPSRFDPEADDMARSADPKRVLERIKDTHEDQGA